MPLNLVLLFSGIYPVNSRDGYSNLHQRNQRLTSLFEVRPLWRWIHPSSPIKRTLMKKIPICLALVISMVSAPAQKPGAIIDVTHYLFQIALNDSNDIIKGDTRIDLLMLADSKSLGLDLGSIDSAGKGMKVLSVQENDRELTFTHTGNLLHINFSETARRGSAKSISIRYEGIPADGLIISTNKFGHRTFFSDNWPNRAHYWVPCADHPADKATVDFIVTAPEHYQVVCNGLQVEENNLPGHLRQTHYQETTVLPTKIMAMAAADFAVNYAGDVGCIPVYSWVYPEEKVNGFYDYALAKEILPFFISHVGPYAYRKLANIQSKTRFGGVENAGAIFYYERSIKGDRKLEPLLAHEIAHQWFGDAVTEKDWSHVWLSEGFATYMTHLYLENKYGTDTLMKGMKRDRDNVISFSKKRQTPIVDTSVAGNYMELLNANSYQKGGWILHMLRRKLGDDVFWKGIRLYYKKFDGSNADTYDFMRSMESVSGMDLKEFFRHWLYTPGQPELRIEWKYDAREKQVRVTVEQLQSTAYDFPLDLKWETSTGSVQKTIHVKERTTRYQIPCASKPSRFVADPQTNLLFEYTSLETP